jgi:hypothetical protein
VWKKEHKSTSINNGNNTVQSRAWRAQRPYQDGREGAQEEVGAGEKCARNENKFTPAQINYALQRM